MKSDNQSCMLLGSTPLEMDDLIYGQVIHDDGSQSVHQQKLLSTKNHEDASSLASTPLKLNATSMSRCFGDEGGGSFGEEENASGEQQQRRQMNELTTLVNDLREQVRALSDQLSTKAQENADLNACLIKQTTLGENLSSVLRVSEEKNKQLESLLEKNTAKLDSLHTENGNFYLDLF